MKRELVKSSSIKSVGYEDHSKILKIEFCRDRVYQYFGVPAAVHQALLGAPSKGRYFNQSIRGRFPFRLIPDLDTVPADDEAPTGCCC